MASNKSIRVLMIKKYGKKCMMEEAGIRKIPVSERRKIKGYRKADDALTYHHLTRKCEGGKATEENGALLKWYNHAWLERQPRAVRELINERLRRYKMRFVGLQLTGDGRIGNQVTMDFDNIGEFIEIPVYPNREEPKKAEERPERINPDDVIRARMEECWYK